MGQYSSSELPELDLEGITLCIAIPLVNPSQNTIIHL